MDGNGWRPAQGDPNVDNNDWRTLLTHESRQRIVNKIMKTLEKHWPITGPEGIVELKEIAVRFEEKIYTAATSQPDYLRKISYKMLSMETTSQPNNVANSLPSNLAVGNQNPPNPAMHNIQSQGRNQGQPLPISVPNQSQARQQLLPSNLQNTITSAAMQGSTNLPSTLSSMMGLTQTSMSNSIGQSSCLQNMNGILQNSVNNSGGQRVPSNMFTNSQRPTQATQQVAPRQHQLQRHQSEFV